jgi:NDP-sugar pyrophosphorylase family protein
MKPLQMNLQAVVLAGGLGTRLLPITETVPKALVQVGGKPFLYWQLQYIKEQGFTDVLLLCAHLGKQIEEVFGDGHEYGIRIQYSFEPEPLGTGGALKFAGALLKPQFCLLNGDSFLKINLTEMLNDYFSRGHLAMISAYAKIDKSPVIANLKVAPNGLVIDYKKDGGKGNGYNAIDSGIYVLTKNILESTKEERFQLEDLWPTLIANKKVGAYVNSEKFFDIGTPERLKVFEEKLRDYFPNSL